jgi:hypothetical protein
MIFKNSVRIAKKTPLHHYKDQLVMLIREIIAVLSHYNTKFINTFCEQNAGLLIIEAGDKYIYHWASKG